MKIPKRIPEPIFADNEHTKLYFKNFTNDVSNIYSTTIHFLMKQDIEFSSVADICGGEGSFLYNLYNEQDFEKGLLIDKEDIPLKIAKERLEKIPNISQVQTRVESLHQKIAEKYELVTCIDSLHELNDIEQASKEISSITKSQGHVYIQDFVRELLPLYANDSHHKQLYHAQEHYGTDYAQEFPLIHKRLVRQKDLFWFSFHASHTTEEITENFENEGLHLIDKKYFTRGARLLFEKE